MDSSSGQSGRPDDDRPLRTGGSDTRGRLLAAAAELIAELGWGRVTTRAVAERAGLPHGAVSYHFRGKQELLIEAAMHRFEQTIPLEEFGALRSVDDLLGMMAAELGGPAMTEPTLPRLMFEAMSEATRDDALRERLGRLLATYRARMTDVVRDEQQRGTVPAGADAAAVATVLGAVGDGLMMHALLDPDLDVGGALSALRTMAGDQGRSR
jgi:AcrR family transcriptional regulator